MSKITCQRHRTCRNIAKRGARHSAGVIPLLEYKYKNKQTTWVFGVGLETGGEYVNQYNLCVGKGEKEDEINGQFCWLKCAKREMLEEIKIKTSFSDKSFDKFFRGSAGSIRYIIHHGTPIFIAKLKDGTSRSSIKKLMQNDCQNSKLSHHYKEMSDFEYFRLDNGLQLDGLNLPLSKFAHGVSKLIDINKL